MLSPEHSCPGPDRSGDPAEHPGQVDGREQVRDHRLLGRTGQAECNGATSQQGPDQGPGDDGGCSGAGHGVAHQRKLHSDQDPNHANPAEVWVSPPTSRTNASSKEPAPRTWSSGPAAATTPSAITATVSHSCSTRDMTWLESTTEPPWVT